MIVPKKKKAPVIFDSDEEDADKDEDTIAEVIPHRRKKLKRLIMESSDEEEDQPTSNMEIDDIVDIASGISKWVNDSWPPSNAHDRSRRRYKWWFRLSW